MEMEARCPNSLLVWAVVTAHFPTFTLHSYPWDLTEGSCEKYSRKEVTTVSQRSKMPGSKISRLNRDINNHDCLISNVIEDSVTPSLCSALVDYYPNYFHLIPVWVQHHTKPEWGEQCFAFRTLNLSCLPNRKEPSQIFNKL